MKCLHCKQPVKTYQQVLPKRTLTMLDCHNPACPLNMYTFSTLDYTEETIKPYLKSDENKESA